MSSIKNCLLFSLFIANSLCISQEKMDASALQEDLTILSEITNELSPKLTDRDRARIVELTKIKRGELDGKKMDAIEFFNFLAHIDFDTKFDEHASLSVTEEVLMPLLMKSKIFPLPIKIISGNMVVVNSTDTELPYGAIIHSINGIRTDSLLKSFTEDYEDTFTKRSIERNFSIIYLIMIGSSETYQIEYYSPSQPSVKINKLIDGIDFEKYTHVFQNTVYPLKKDELDKLINTDFYEDDKTYYLQLNSFSWNDDSDKGFFNFLNSNHKKFDKRFKSVFDEIAKYGADNLVIDLRYNMGGNVKVPGILYSYIALDDFEENVRIEMQDFDIPRPELIKQIQGEQNKETDFVNEFVRKYKKQFEQQDDLTYLWPIIENEIKRPSKNAFKGNVYVLVSGRSISASAYFSALFKSNNRGTIIGEQMGGSYQALSAGKILTYELPNTKIQLATPIMLVSFPKELNDKIKESRITPDILFEDDKRYEFLLEKKDIEIEKVLELIHKKNFDAK